MSESHDCCRSTPPPSHDEWGRCPVCKGHGKPVSPKTLRALLHPSLLDQVKDEPYWFCASTACQVVYFRFRLDSAQTFVRKDLTVRVGVKETHAPRPLCYCFGHTEESLREAWLRTGADAAVAGIQAAVKAGTCRCEVTNPQGGCCLGEVLKALKELKTLTPGP